jgi:putative hydrolase of the HAD superfamily
MTKAIVFDFYGVVCSEIGSPWYKKISSSKTIERLHKQYDKPSNLGLISEDEFFNGIARAVNQSGEFVRKEWVDAAVINQDLISLVAELKTSYSIALCSNTQPKLFRELIEESDIKELFDVIVSSSEIGIMKPDHKIFEHTLQLLGTFPEETVFIDDRQVNIEGARALGIQSILYKNVDQIKSELNNIL